MESAQLPDPPSSAPRSAHLAPGAPPANIAPGGCEDRPDVAVLFEDSADRNGLDRMLLALAVHPSGGTFSRAHLLLWNVGRGLLEGRLSWARLAETVSLVESLRAARRHATHGADPEPTRHLRALMLTPEQLPDGWREAWARSEVTLVTADPGGALPWDSCREAGAVPLSCGDESYGLIVGEWVEPGGAAGRARLEWLQRIANQALSAYATREEVRHAARQAAALAELARAAVSSLNVAEIGSLVTRLACQGTGARGAALWRRGERGGPVLQATHGPNGTRERVARSLQPLASATLERGSATVLDRLVDEPLLSPEAAAQLTALAMVPVAAYGGMIGALAIYDRSAFHPAESYGFGSADIRFLDTVADLAAVAVEQARRTAEVRRAEVSRQELQRELVRTERLAALGEMAARVAQEIRNPLASIGAFARRVHRALAEEDPNREYLEIVMRETDRLERLVGEQLQYAAIEQPRLRLESVNTVLQEALQKAGEQLVRRRVRLLKKLSPDLPPLVLDRERIRRVVGNILGSALESVSPGGRIRVESRRVQDHVVVDVAHDGARVPGELLDQLFVPFTLSSPGNAAVGLAVAQQIVQQHGGEVRVRSEGEWSTIFSFTLPIPHNEDRRHTLADRRSPRGDRRERYPAR